MQERSAFDFGGNRIVRQSEPMKIGKHEWRLTLYRSPHHEHPLIGYEWRRADGAPIRRTCPGGTVLARRLHLDARPGLALLQPQRRRVGRYAAHAAHAVGTVPVGAHAQDPPGLKLPDSATHPRHRLHRLPLVTGASGEADVPGRRAGAMERGDRSSSPLPSRTHPRAQPAPAALQARPGLRAIAVAADPDPTATRNSNEPTNRHRRSRGAAGRRAHRRGRSRALVRRTRTRWMRTGTAARGGRTTPSAGAPLAPSTARPPTRMPPGTTSPRRASN